MRLLPSSPALRLAPLWPALAALVTATFLLALLLPPLFERHTANQLLDALEILAPAAAERLAAGGDPQGWAERLAAGKSLRLTLVARDGRVLADSARNRAGLATMESHAGRPEVRQAQATGAGTAVRRSATTGVVYVYAARTFTGPDGRVYVLRLALPLGQVRELTRRLTGVMALAAAVAGAVILLLSWRLDRRVFEPLAHLITGAGELAAGGGHRVPVPDSEELADLALALNRLADEAGRQVAAARAERDTLGAILAAMVDGVLVVDGDGRALLANPAFRALFEVAGEVAGRRALELVRQPELARLLEVTLESGAPQAGELELRGREPKSVALASAPLPVGMGRGVGAVLVARDTTAAARLATMRRDFVANVSHELKTPLAAIRGYAETLRDGALSEPATARRFTERILDQSRRLEALLADLLTLSRLEGLEAARPREPVDLGELAREAVELVAGRAAERGVTLTTEVQDTPRLAGDPRGLERLLVNLLDNAVKYNRPGGSAVLAIAARQTEVLIEVRDTGIGIPAEAIPRLFERFYRVDKGRAREEGGTGLGLAIVKHVAQAHGGQIEVESRAGQGSVFRVRLPLALI